MKNLFIRFGVTLFLISSIMVSCNREDVVEITDPQLQLEEVKQMMKKDNLTEEEIAILYKKVDALPKELTYDSYEPSFDDEIKGSNADADAVYCVYGMVNVIGDCDTDGDGNLVVCFLCPGGMNGCPGSERTVWRHYDSDGNLICMGNVSTNSTVCKSCPDGGFKVRFRNLDAVPIR